MPKYPIDLQENGRETMPSLSMGGPRPCYPCLHLHWDEQYDLPEDGIMTVKFHKRRETNTESDDGDSQSVELEVLSIESVEAAEESDEPEKTDREKASEALDKYVEESSEED